VRFRWLEPGKLAALQQRNVKSLQNRAVFENCGFFLATQLQKKSRAGKHGRQVLQKTARIGIPNKNLRLAIGNLPRLGAFSSV